MLSQRYWMQEATNHSPWESEASQNLELANMTATQNKPLKIVVIVCCDLKKYFPTFIISSLLP